MPNTRLRTIIRSVIVLTLCLAARPAAATTILDTGNVVFSPDGTQFGRISRDGVSSDWGAPKAFPGVTGAPATRLYDLFAVESDIFQFLQITLDDPTSAFFASAYLNAFTPVNVSPNFGLNVNYLGDPGSTQPIGNPSFFQIVVAPHSQVLIPINEVNPATGAGRSFHLIVEGFTSADFDDVVDWHPNPIPEPATSALFASGLAASALVRKARQRRLRRQA